MHAQTIHFDPIAADTRPPARVGVFGMDDWGTIAPKWTDLHSACGGSVFLSTEWIEVWLEVFGRGMKTEILLVEAGPELIGACLMSCYQGGSSWLPLKRLALNGSGEARPDTTYAEYNDLLCRPGWEHEVRQALIARMNELDWDELRIEGFVPGGSYQAICEGFGELERSEVRHPSYFIDLAAIRRRGLSYEMALNSAHRRYLKQKTRFYAEKGELTFTVARDKASALVMFDQLAAANVAHRNERGNWSVFSSPQFVEFHRRFIARHMASKVIQMVQLRCAGKLIGTVYNLVQNGKVYFYQCGYEYTEDKRLSPGTVTLSFVIQHSLEMGFDDFDFLSGQAQYKQTMSTGARDLVWTVVRRKTLKNTMMKGLRSIRQRLRERSR